MKLLTIAALAALFAFPAFAQQNCGPTQAVMMELLNRYSENVVDDRMVDHPQRPNAQIQLLVWANTDTGTWTVTGTDGQVTCVFAFGQDYDGQDVDWFLAEVNGETDA